MVLHRLNQMILLVDAVFRNHSVSHSSQEDDGGDTKLDAIQRGKRWRGSRLDAIASIDIRRPEQKAFSFAKQFGAAPKPKQTMPGINRAGAIQGPFLDFVTT